MSKATLARLDKAEAKLVEKRANLLELLVDRTITKRDWLEKEAEYTAKLALIEAERKQVIDDLQVDPIELAGVEEDMLRQQEHYLAKGGSKDDFVGKQDWAFLIAAMDLRVEVSPEAERIFCRYPSG